MAIFREFEKWTMGAAVALLALGGSAWAQERPLAEVAKEKSGKAATRVFTDEDLEASRPAEAAAPSAGLNAEAAPAGKDTQSARLTVPGLLQEGSLQEARALLKSLQHDEEVLLRRYAQIEEKLAGEKDEHLRQLYSNSLARRDETLARKRGQIAQVTKAIGAAESSRTSSPGSRHEAEPKVEK
jgi:hypothetical protein